MGSLSFDKYAVNPPRNRIERRWRSAVSIVIDIMLGITIAILFWVGAICFLADIWRD